MHTVTDDDELTPILDRRAAKAVILARQADPTTPAFDGAVAIACDECGRHLGWVNPPAPPAPVVCTEHRRTGALTVDPPT